MSESPPAFPGPSPAGSDRTPARALHDARLDRLWVVLDVLPATAADLSVAVSTDQVRIAVDHPDFPDGFERVVTAPSDERVFQGAREAVIRNGVLTVTVTTARRSVD